MLLCVRLVVLCALLVSQSSWALESKPREITVNVKRIKANINESKPCSTPLFVITIDGQTKLAELNEIKKWINIEVIPATSDDLKRVNLDRITAEAIPNNKPIAYPITWGIDSLSVAKKGRRESRTTLIIFGNEITPHIALKFRFTKSKSAPASLTYIGKTEHAIAFSNRVSRFSVTAYLSAGKTTYADHALNNAFDFSKSYNVSERIVYDAILNKGLVVACQKGKDAALIEMKRLKKMSWGNFSSVARLDLNILALKKYREADKDFIFTPKDIASFMAHHDKMAHQLASKDTKDKDVLELKRKWRAEKNSRHAKFE